MMFSYRQRMPVLLLVFGLTLLAVCAAGFGWWHLQMGRTDYLAEKATQDRLMRTLTTDTESLQTLQQHYAAFAGLPASASAEKRRARILDILNAQAKDHGSIVHYRFLEPRVMPLHHSERAHGVVAETLVLKGTAKHMPHIYALFDRLDASQERFDIRGCDVERPDLAKGGTTALTVTCMLSWYFLQRSDDT